MNVLNMKLNKNIIYKEKLHYDYIIFIVLYI